MNNNKHDFTPKRLVSAISRASRQLAAHALPTCRRWLSGSVIPVLQRSYARLPNKPAVLGAVATVLAVAVIGPALLQPADTEFADRSTSAGAVQPAAREARWVEQLLSNDWPAQQAAARAVLEAVGATLLDDDAPLPDREGLFVSSPELLILAMDGARKVSSSRLSLAELALMLDDFGFGFPEDQSPPAILESALREWVRTALDRPDSSGAAAARFLHAMAARQSQPIDLASEFWSAEEHKLTHLELFALLAAFGDDSGAGQQAAADSTFPTTGRLLAMPLNRLLDAAIPPAMAANGRSAVCSPLLSHYVNSGQSLDFGQNNKTMEGILGTIGKLAEQAGRAGVAAAKAYEAINLALKLQKLVLLYSSIDMRLTADQDAVHKAHQGEPDKEVVFNVTVGLDEEKYQEFVDKLNASESGRAMKDCLASLGLPAPTDMWDILEEMKDWDVVWSLNGGNSIWTMFSTGHASWDPAKNGFDGPGLSREPLTPIDATHVGADFIVDIARDEHEEGGIVTTNISAEATLHSDAAMPGSEVAAALQASWRTMLDGELSAGTLGLLGTVIGALGSAGAEVASGWARRLWDPEVLYYVTVAYHQPRHPAYTYEGTVTADFSFKRVIDRRGRREDDGEYTDYSENLRWQGRMVASDLRTVRMMHWQGNEGVDLWNLEGDARISGSYSLHSVSDSLNRCAGALLQLRRETRERRGGGSNTGTQAYGLEIAHAGDRVRDRDYALQLNLRSVNLDIPYQDTYRDTGQAGCEFSSRDGWDRVSHNERLEGIGAQTFSHRISLDEPYPETIVGQQTVTEQRLEGDEVRTTTWTWSLRRVDPIEGGVP